MSDEKIELHKAVREGAEKYIYFLLAASGAAIGFALNQTQEAVLKKSMIVLAIAVALWAFSFYCGCKQLEQSRHFTFQNYELLRIRAGEHTAFPRQAAGTIMQIFGRTVLQVGQMGRLAI